MVELSSLDESPFSSDHRAKTRPEPSMSCGQKIVSADSRRTWPSVTYGKSHVTRIMGLLHIAFS
jgi:hypothetical protein